MSEQEKKQNIDNAEVTEVANKKVFSHNLDSPRRKNFGKRLDKGDELEQKIINIRRVTRVVSGGRRMSFSVFLVAGDKKGSIGLGMGKAIDTSLAISKALRSAKKNMIKISSTKDNSILHEVTAKFGSSKVIIMPNKARGLVAGSAVRDVLRLAGIKNVTSKVLTGSKNKLNIARAAMKALAQLRRN